MAIFLLYLKRDDATWLYRYVRYLNLRNLIAYLRYLWWQQLWLVHTFYISTSLQWSVLVPCIAIHLSTIIARLAR